MIQTAGDLFTTLVCGPFLTTSAVLRSRRSSVHVDKPTSAVGWRERGRNTGRQTAADWKLQFSMKIEPKTAQDDDVLRFIIGVLIRQ